MLRSQPSQEQAVVTFVNTTSSYADVIWFNFEGQMIRYGTLHPGASLRMNTFTQHPWKCFDSSTGTELYINSEPIYYPVSLRELHQRVNNLQIVRAMRCPANNLVYITTPKSNSSLYKLTLLYLLRHLKEVTDPLKLNIPEFVRSDLKQLIATRNEYFQRVVNY